jgi:1-acyl-sn-glycerol-3-phosphate acyltransferase
MSDWLADRPPAWRPRGGDWLRILWRGGTIGALVYGGLAVLLLLRLLEAPLFGPRRPLTPHITRFVCRNTLRLMGLPLRRRGRPMRMPGAVVANHGSWLDILALNAADCVYFVAKSEVAGWPGVGWLARATGTVFIARRGSEARAQTALFERRLAIGHRLLFFPEGTSTDARRVLPFKSTLFAAFFTEALRDRLSVQPVTVAYHPPAGADPRFYGWWGDMGFGPHLMQMLAARRHGAVEVIYHAPLRVADAGDRKVLAARCERVIRDALHTALDAGSAQGREERP